MVQVLRLPLERAGDGNVARDMFQAFRPKAILPEVNRRAGTGNIIEAVIAEVPVVIGPLVPKWTFRACTLLFKLDIQRASRNPTRVIYQNLHRHDRVLSMQHHGQKNIRNEAAGTQFPDGFCEFCPNGLFRHLSKTRHCANLYETHDAALVRADVLSAAKI